MIVYFQRYSSEPTPSTAAREKIDGTVRDELV